MRPSIQAEADRAEEEKGETGITSKGVSEMTEGLITVSWSSFALVALRISRKLNGPESRSDVTVKSSARE